MIDIGERRMCRQLILLQSGMLQLNCDIEQTRKSRNIHITMYIYIHKYIFDVI